jgi:hypothetical protein
VEPGECLEFSLVKYPKYIANSYGNARVFFMAKDLIARLNKGNYYLHRVGDAISSRNIHAAIYDSLRICKNI